MLMAYTTSHAGTLSDGTWSPTSCGEKPVTPKIMGNSIDQFNKSIKAANSWQERANAYNACMVKEANADNSVIAKTANAAQEKFQAEIDHINKEMVRLQSKLEGK